MSIARVALEEDLNANYDLQRLSERWSTEQPVSVDTNLSLAELGSKTQTYADFMREKGLKEQEILKACTYSRAALEALLQNSSGLRIYLAADTKVDENGEEYTDIFPIVVPVNNAFEDLLDENPTNQKLILDIASRCPPPAGACTQQFFKISPQ